MHFADDPDEGKGAPQKEFYGFPGEKKAKRCVILKGSEVPVMYILIAALFSVLVGLLTPNVSEAYIWRCHTPNGDIWTEQPSPNADCQEFDGTYNPGAAPPPGYSQPSQPAPQPQAPPPTAVLPPPYVYAPYPYPYYGYPYPPYYYPRPGVYLGLPFFGFNFGFGHGGHFRH